MPINRIENQLDRQGILGNFPRLGKLRKGAEKADGKTVGRDLGYFRATFEPQYEDLIRPAFTELYGEQPTEFRNVLIAAENADSAFQYWFEEWAHARLLRRCDGDNIVVSFEEASQRYDQTPHACTCDPLKRDCNERGTLDIVLPALFEKTGIWGKFTVQTGSIYDIVALRSAMRIASVFTSQLPNVAFWSIPFRVGRAMRPVPVTINGKRSVKSMSLLYADIEQDFNRKVFTPLLTRPAQLLLAGVNPETGESPEGGLPDIEFTQTANWDRDYINEQTLHLFDHQNHQDNAIDKMIADGLLTDDMDDDTAIQIIETERARRAAEKQTETAAKNGSKSRQKGANSSADELPVQSDLNWAADAKNAAKFIAAANQRLGLNTGDVLEALRYLSVDPLDSIQEFIGTKESAWAACIAAQCHYDLGTVDQMLTRPEEQDMRRMVHDIIQAGTIPF